MPTRVLLADDHCLIRQSLHLLLEHEGLAVVGEAGDGLEAVQLAAKLQPDVAVLDIGMERLNGLDALKEIHGVSPRTRCVVLTVHEEEPYLLDALRAGAKGYVLKTHAAEDLLHAIREAARGGVFLSPEVSRTLVQAYQSGATAIPEPLSPRERQVLQLIAEGKTTKEAAALLHISTKTAETHRTRIMEKLGIHATAGLVRYAIRRGVIQA